MVIDAVSAVRTTVILLYYEVKGGEKIDLEKEAY